MLSDGLHPNLSREGYDAIDAVNFSTLKWLGKSPLHYRHHVRRPSKDTPAKKLGRAVHLAVLEPERFASMVAVWDGAVRRGKEWNAFVREHEGREILTEAESAQVDGMAAAVRGNPAAVEILAGTRTEVAALWTVTVKASETFPGGVVRCKGRVDAHGPAGLVEVKTTRDASPDGFGREAWRYRYPTQAAFYASGIEAITGSLPPHHTIAIENVEPYVVAVYRTPPQVLEVGRQECRDLLRMLVQCRAEGRWPGYVVGVSDLTLPKYAVDFGEDDDVTGIGLIAGDAA